MPEYCLWRCFDFVDGTWKSACSDRLFMFENGGPMDNHFGFCPYCGKPLQEAEGTDEYDEHGNKR